MAKRKSAIDDLESGRVPHIVHMIPPGAPGFREAGGGAMVISSPAEVDGLVRQLRRGEVITLDDLRGALARRHAVAVACPVSTAIFLNMAARAAEERRLMGVPEDELTPWWRVLKKGGFLTQVPRRRRTAGGPPCCRWCPHLALAQAARRLRLCRAPTRRLSGGARRLGPFRGCCPGSPRGQTGARARANGVLVLEPEKRPALAPVAFTFALER